MAAWRDELCYVLEMFVPLLLGLAAAFGEKIKIVHAENGIEEALGERRLITVRDEVRCTPFFILPVGHFMMPPYPVIGRPEGRYDIYPNNPRTGIKPSYLFGGIPFGTTYVKDIPFCQGRKIFSKCAGNPSIFCKIGSSITVSSSVASL